MNNNDELDVEQMTRKNHDVKQEIKYIKPVEQMTKEQYDFRKKAMEKSCSGGPKKVVPSKSEIDHEKLKKIIERVIAILAVTATLAVGTTIIKNIVKDDDNYSKTIEFAAEDMIESGYFTIDNGQVNFSKDYSPNEIVNEIKTRYNLDQEKNAYGNETHEALLFVKEAAGMDDFEAVTGRNLDNFCITYGYTSTDSNGITYPNQQMLKTINQDGLIEGIEKYEQTKTSGKAK